MNCLQHHHTFSFLKIFKVASDEADPPFHSSLFTPTRRLHFERKHSFPASAKLPPKPSQPLLNLVWWNKYQGNIFRLILLLQTVLLLRAMSLHRQPHEEQEEIFSTILSSFSSLAATSPSFSSCFPEHSEINSALLLLKVRRGTWLKKVCWAADRPTFWHQMVFCQDQRSMNCGNVFTVRLRYPPVKPSL